MEYYFEKEYPLDCEQILQEIPDFTEQPIHLFAGASVLTEAADYWNDEKEKGLSQNGSNYGQPRHHLASHENSTDASPADEFEAIVFLESSNEPAVQLVDPGDEELDRDNNTLANLKIR